MATTEDAGHHVGNTQNTELTPRIRVHYTTGIELYVFGNNKRNIKNETIAIMYIYNLSSKSKPYACCT